MNNQEIHYMKEGLQIMEDVYGMSHMSFLTLRLTLWLNEKWNNLFTSFDNNW